jgi:3-keto-disaccharide hydrolase
MFTKDTYDNFIARLEFKLPKGGNNGLALRSPITDKEVAYEGMETQILDNTAAKYANLHEYQFHGSLYGLAPAIKGYLRPVGQWNYEEVTVKGDELTVAVNGFEILKTNIAKVREKPMDGKAHPGASRSDGHFGLLGHTDPVAFRNIRIKRLTTK